MAMKKLSLRNPFVVKEGEEYSPFKKFLLNNTTITILCSLLCALIGLFIGYIVLFIIAPQGANEAIGVLIKNFMKFNSSKLRLKNLGSTLAKTAPLIMTGLSVLFAYKAGLFNIGAAGQYTIAIAACMYPAIAWHLPWYVCLLFAVLAGAIWGAIPGILKAFLNVNEVISAIMTNWIGLYLTNWIMSNPTVMDPTKSETYGLASKSPQSILPTLGLNKLFSDNKYVTVAILIAVIVAVIINVILSKTTFGYELKATGNNKNAAKYAGMKEKRNIILTLVISGALAGLGAALYYLTDIEQWITASSVPGMGFSGISAAFLGGLNPIGTIFAAYFLTHITQAGAFLDTTYYNAQIADLISSIIIYLCAFVLFFKTAFVKKLSSKKEKKPVVQAEAKEVK